MQAILSLNYSSNLLSDYWKSETNMYEIQNLNLEKHLPGS